MSDQVIATEAQVPVVNTAETTVDPPNVSKVADGVTVGDAPANAPAGNKNPSNDKDTGDDKDRKSSRRRGSPSRSRSHSRRRSSRDRESRRDRDSRREDKDKDRKGRYEDKDRSRRTRRSRSRSKDRSKRDETKELTPGQPTSEGQAAAGDSVENDKKNAKKSNRRSRSRSRSGDRRRRSPSRDRRRSGSRDRRRRSSSRDRDERRRRRSRSRSHGRRDRDSRRYRRDASPSSDRDHRRRDRRRSKSRSPVSKPSAPPQAMIRVSDIIQDVLQKKTSFGLPGGVGAPLNPALTTMNALAASKPARELYIGGIPMGISALQLQNVCSTLLQQLGGCTSPGNPVVTGWIASDGVFGFVEFRSVEECNNALVLLNGQPCMGGIMRVGRPKSYPGDSMGVPMMPGVGGFTGGLGGGLAGLNMLTGAGIPTLPGGGLGVPPFIPGASMMAPTTPAISAAPSTTAGAPPGTEKIVLSNIPPHLRDKATLLEILSALGDIKDCTIVTDSKTGAARDVAVLEFANRTTADIAFKAIPSISIGAAPLVCEWVADSILLERTPTKFVELTNIAVDEEIGNDDDIEALKEDVASECGQFGTVVNTVVPKLGDPKAGLMFIQFETERAAMLCVKGLRGRIFADRAVGARFVDPEEVPSA